MRTQSALQMRADALVEGVTIEQAQDADLADFAQLQLQGWQQAYAHLLSADFLHGSRLREDRQAFWARRFAGRHAGQLLAVARQAGRCVGVLCAFEALTPTGDACLEHLYVAPQAQAQGRGVGRQLMRHAAQWWGTRGVAGGVTLSVLAQNHGAVALYRRLGGVTSPLPPWLPSGEEHALDCWQFRWASLGVLQRQLSAAAGEAGRD